jgi:hypothetical protein
MASTPPPPVGVQTLSLGIEMSPDDVTEFKEINERCKIFIERMKTEKPLASSLSNPEIDNDTKTLLNQITDSISPAIYIAILRGLIHKAPSASSQGAPLDTDADKEKRHADERHLIVNLLIGNPSAYTDNVRGLFSTLRAAVGDDCVINNDFKTGKVLEKLIRELASAPGNCEEAKKPSDTLMGKRAPPQRVKPGEFNVGDEVSASAPNVNVTWGYISKKNPASQQGGQITYELQYMDNDDLTKAWTDVKNAKNPTVPNKTVTVGHNDVNYYYPTDHDALYKRLTDAEGVSIINGTLVGGSRQVGGGDGIISSGYNSLYEEVLSLIYTVILGKDIFFKNFPKLKDVKYDPSAWKSILSLLTERVYPNLTQNDMGEIINLAAKSTTPLKFGRGFYTEVEYHGRIYGVKIQKNDQPFLNEVVQFITLNSTLEVSDFVPYVYGFGTSNFDTATDEFKNALKILPTFSVNKDIKPLVRTDAEMKKREAEIKKAIADAVAAAKTLADKNAAAAYLLASVAGSAPPKQPAAAAAAAAVSKRTYAWKTKESDSYGYIIMEQVRGLTIDELSGKLTDDEKGKIERGLTRYNQRFFDAGFLNYGVSSDNVIVRMNKNEILLEGDAAALLFIDFGYSTWQATALTVEKSNLEVPLISPTPGSMHVDYNSEGVTEYSKTYYAPNPIIDVSKDDFDKFLQVKEWKIEYPKEGTPVAGVPQPAKYYFKRNDVLLSQKKVIEKLVVGASGDRWSYDVIDRADREQRFINSITRDVQTTELCDKILKIRTADGN